MANDLGVDVGLMVALNFAYELRSLSSIGHPNTTGGKLPPQEEFAPHGACTSIVAGLYSWMFFLMNYERRLVVPFGTEETSTGTFPTLCATSPSSVWFNFKCNI